MSNLMNIYVDGQWSAPVGQETLDVINPATEQAYARIALAGIEDVNRAVAAARRAFERYGQSTQEDRIALLERVLQAFDKRAEEMAQAITAEMGAPLSLSRDAQVGASRLHLETTLNALRGFEFSAMRGTTQVVREPVGVCALITPWNWPLYQVVCKVAPALAAGCCMILKPSEVAPVSSVIFAEVLHDAGVPAGVFNLLQGTGAVVGEALSAHPGIDMVSFTGSTRAGVAVARSAAETVKRVAQELGGKSANIIFEDADFDTAVAKGVTACFGNSGQSCDAPTRMLVPEALAERAYAVAARTAEGLRSGDPLDPETDLGPVVSELQFGKIQGHIDQAIADGARVVAGGPGRPQGLEQGYYVRPTVMGDVTRQMALFYEEVFGPVLAISTYRTEAQAIEMANDSVYGLAAYVQSGDIARARRVAGRLRAGSVYLNYPDFDACAPFGGFKQSGNGREFADWGIHDFVEIKGIQGWNR